METKKLLVTLILFVSLLNAITITGEGIGNTKTEAQKNALADLSNKISVEVKSDFKTYTSIIDEDYKTNAERVVQLSSSLPIISVQFEHLDSTRLTTTIAILSGKNALKGYVMELNRLKKEIETAYSNISTIKSDGTKYKLLNQVFQDIESFNKYKIVAVMLEGKELPTLNITSSEIKTKLLKFEDKVNTIQLAAKLLIKDIKKDDIYISAPITSVSSQITQFAKVLKDEISKHLSHIKYSKDAQYFFRGTYDILDDEIFVAMKLYDESNNILKTNTVKLSKKAYSHTKYKPTTKSFDEAINTEFVKSGDLSVSIGFKGYNRAEGIDLNEGDIVDIIAKTNKPICYFLVGHTLHNNNQFSYLLPIGSDNSPFINYITGEDVNKLITIVGEVPISEPFGTENLQIFASTFKDKCTLSVPKCNENSEGYCVIGGTPSQVVTKTRGLNLKKKKFKVEKTEASLSWTSFGK